MRLSALLLQREPYDPVAQVVIANALHGGCLWDEAVGRHAGQRVDLEKPGSAFIVQDEIRPGVNPQVKALHIERLHYAGLADNAFSDLLFGSAGMGIGKLLLGLLLYLGLVLFVTVKLFDKKELEF